MKQLHQFYDNVKKLSHLCLIHSLKDGHLVGFLHWPLQLRRIGLGGQADSAKFDIHLVAPALVHFAKS
jgi:hypothetical protein